MSNTIKIHKGFPEKLLKNNQFFKGMCIFYSLKYMYSGGIILNINKRHKEIAQKLEISETNLRSKIKYLISIKLIIKENNNLNFVSFNHLKKKYNLKTFKNFKLKYSNPKKLEILIKSLIIQENFDKQRYKLKEKFINKELRKFGTIQAKTTRQKIRKYLRNNYDGLFKNQMREISPSSFKGFEFKKSLNEQITISRKGISNLLNKKSKSTGSRFIKKMKKNNIIESDSKNITLVHRKINSKIIRSLELDSSYFIYNNNLYKRYSNNIVLSTFFA